MSISLTTFRGKPAVELADHKGECWLYLWRLRCHPRRGVWLLRLAVIDPETCWVALDRTGRPRLYRLRIHDSGFVRCSCPDWKFRNRQHRSREAGADCKHLEVGRELLALLRSLQGNAS